MTHDSPSLGLAWLGLALLAGLLRRACHPVPLHALPHS